jgi:hypothetical protein
MVPVLLAMTGLAIDVGGYADDKRTLQNASDAIALAAAKDLCTPNPADCSNTSAATTTAQAYAAKNNIDWSKVTLTFANIAVTPNGNPTVRATITTSHKFSFIRILGINSKNVSAKAAAIKTSPGGVGGITPWAIVSPPPMDGSLVTLKYDATNPTNGNFQAIQVDNGSGSGSSTYQQTIQEGSTSIICAAGVTTCTNTSPVCPTYDQCPSETGNKVSGTQNGVDFLINNTIASCDTFAEAFSGPDASGKYNLNAACNPWAQGPGYCPNPDTSPAALCSRRVIIIPIVNGFGSGSSAPVTVLSFALFWLEGYQTGQCTGNNCNIQGRFVKADLTINALAGIYDAGSSIHFVRLSE